MLSKKISVRTHSKVVSSSKDGYMTTVTFDSNVWEEVVDDSKRTEGSVYDKIFEEIESGNVKPLFFEGLAILESIPKKDRKDYIRNYKASLSIQLEDAWPHVTEGSAAPEVSEYLNNLIPKALKMGFKFIHIPRISAPSLNLPKKYKAPDEKYPLPERLDRTFRCIQFIENLGAGKSRIKNRLDGDGIRGIVSQTKEDSSLSERQYAKDIGEWVDGDALAAHFGFGSDYFCTNDQAKGAGAFSIFHPHNLSKLAKEFGIQVVSPNDLVSILKNGQWRDNA